MSCEDTFDRSFELMASDEEATPSLVGVSVIVPAYNEESAVAGQVLAIRRVLAAGRISHEVIVVDDGSEDRTAPEATAAGARVLSHTENRGYGASIKTGILAAQHDRIVIIDADGTYPSEAIPELIAGLASADMTVGARVGAAVHIPWVRRPAKWVLGWLANRVAGRRVPDLNSGLRAFYRQCVTQYFPLLSDRFSFTTTVTLALLADDYRVTYQAIDYHPRVGRSKIRPWHFMEFVMLVLRMAMLFQPLKVFAPLAIGCAGLGFMKVVFDVFALFERARTQSWSLVYQPVVSTSAILLLLVALQLLLVGMMADGVLRRMAQQRAPLIPSRAVRVTGEVRTTAYRVPVRTR
jgi:glycosyltransferase involved in cell wall biosynthesis